MSFERQFVLAGRGLALLGVLSLGVTREVSLLYVVLAAGALGWTALRGWQGRGHDLDVRLANATSAASMVLIFAPVVLRGTPPIQAIAEFLLVLTALRALAAQTARDWLQIYALSFFEMVAASALTIEPVFAFVFVAYLLLAPWALVLLCLRGELVASGNERRLADERFVDASLFRGVAGVTLVLFVSTLTVFVFFPRMGAGFFASPLATGQAITGFGDEVGLGDVTALKADETVAMRVTVDRPDRLRRRPQYWRGAALEEFDGRRWRRGRSQLRGLSRVRPGLFLVGGTRRPRDLLWQEVILEPMENPTLFFLGQPVQLQGRFGTVLVDDLGNLRAVTPPGVRLRYEVLSSVGPRDDPPGGRSRKIGAVDPRVLELARSVAAGSKGDAARAEALLEHFRRGFRYTMTPGDPGDRDPLAWFLLESRQGHCEYFASALAVMLRAVGIPSLVVNGYHGGEWNPYGGYLIVRQSDAHSWVEAYVDGEWRTFDPTPPSGQPPARARFRSFAALLDAYRMRWYRYVINYTLQDQVDLAFRLRASSRRFWDGVRGDSWRDAWERLRGAGTQEGGAPSAGLAAALVVGAIALLAYAWRRTRPPKETSGWATSRYVALLRLLERRGLAKRPGETPDEFLRKVEPALDGDRDAVARLTALYQEARFSGRESTEQRAEMDALLGTLEQRE